MSKSVANQLFVAYLGRPADVQWQSATAAFLDNLSDSPSVALQTSMYDLAVADGALSATASLASLVNTIFLNTFGFAASLYEQNAWANMVTTTVISKQSLPWSIFSSYLGATNVPDIYKLPTQSKLIAADAYTNAITGMLNADFSQLDSLTTVNARNFLNGVTSQASAALAITNVSSNLNAFWSSGSGLGQINSQKALALATGTNVFSVALNSTYTGKGVVIADIDTGIDLNNSALTHNLSQYNWNFVSNSANVQDDNGHGSFTASQLIATTANNNGVVGGAYDAQLMVLKAVNATGTGTDSTIAAAITYATDHGANVINLSFGGSAANAALQSALQYAASHGVVVAVAAGNSAASLPAFPAYYAQSISTVLAVGASQQTGSSVALASFSNQAGNTTPYRFVDALGVGISGYNANSQVITQSGTSVSAPIVASEAAQLWQAIAALHPEYNQVQLATQVVADITQTTTALSLIGISSAFV
jgi:subtilisin family serine protease